MALSSNPEVPAAITEGDVSRLQSAAHEAVSRLTVDYMNALARHQAQDSANQLPAEPDRGMPQKSIFRLGPIKK